MLSQMWIIVYVNAQSLSGIKNNPYSRKHPGRGGVTTTYPGTGCAFIGVPFIEQKINVGVSISIKSQVVINFGVSFFKSIL